PFRVRYSEIDMQGVVFNAHYLTYCDTAITEYMRYLGYSYNLEQIKESGEDFHLVKSTIEYRAPIYFDDDLEVYVKAGRIGRTSLTWQIGIFRQDEDVVLSAAEIVWVHVNLHEHKSTPLPAELIGRLEAENQQV
ncbi:MAG: acyl-CoA thioesterase, partial [Anaerolineales bacterium]|nr:acyl-CoA thioesterase [Anaerolineales bacterium]